MAGPNRLVCYFRESPMLDLSLSHPGSSSSRHGRIPPVLGQSPGLCVSSVVHHSQGSGETQGISGNRAHLGGSILAPTGLVSRPPPVAGPSCSSAVEAGPPAFASLSQPLPGPPQAAPSCLETPALHACVRFLFHSSLPGCLSVKTIVAQGLSAQVAGVQVLVPLSRSLSLSTFSG